MNSLIELIQDHFGLGSPPSSDNLVEFDGFDELDKKACPAGFSRNDH